jgi:hypothetical protein
MYGMRTKRYVVIKAEARVRPDDTAALRWDEIFDRAKNWSHTLCERVQRFDANQIARGVAGV